MKLAPLASAAIHEVNALLTSFPELAEDEQLCADMIEGETTALAAVERMTTVLRETEARREGRTKLVKELQGKNATDDAMIEKLRSAILSILEAANLSGYRCPAATLGKQRQAGGLKFAADFDAAKLPEAMRETEIILKPNKPAILKALENGEHVPGAYIGNSTTVLTVR